MFNESKMQNVRMKRIMDLMNQKRSVWVKKIKYLNQNKFYFLLYEFIFLANQSAGTILMPSLFFFTNAN
jgi:hypothetical protein